MAMFDLDRLITDLFKTTVLPGIAIGLWLTDLIGSMLCKCGKGIVTWWGNKHPDPLGVHFWKDANRIKATGNGQGRRWKRSFWTQANGARLLF